MPPQADIDARLPSAGILSPVLNVLTDDTLEILQYAVDAVAVGISAALVMLVEVHGGAARLPGACMVVKGDGRYCGFVRMARLYARPSGTVRTCTPYPRQ